MNVLTPPRVSAILASAALAGFGFGALTDWYDGRTRVPVSESTETTPAPSPKATPAPSTPKPRQDESYGRDDSAGRDDSTDHDNDREDEDDD